MWSHCSLLCLAHPKPYALLSGKSFRSLGCNFSEEDEHESGLFVFSNTAARGFLLSIPGEFCFIFIRKKCQINKLQAICLWLSPTCKFQVNLIIYLSIYRLMSSSALDFILVPLLHYTRATDLSIEFLNAAPVVVTKTHLFCSP